MLKNNLRFGKFIVFLCIFFVSQCFASPIGTPYFAFTGGYQHYENIYSNDGDTSVARLALGTSFLIYPNLAIGGETGIQTGSRLRIDSSNVAETLGTLPIFLNIRPPIDLLATIKLDFNACFFLKGKVGAAFVKGVVDSVTVNNKSQVRPEIQVGGGWSFSPRTNLVAYYQGIAGNTPKLSLKDELAGTATLHQLPAAQAIFVGIETNL